MSLQSNVHHIHRVGPLVYVTFPSFEETRLVRHLFTTRRGGLSTGERASLNLGFRRGDPPGVVYENFRRVCFVSGIYPGDIVTADQVHADRILEVGPGERGQGIMRPKQIEGVDALITNSREVALMTYHADCPSIFLLDPIRKAIGLAHAGWRGTVLEIAAKTAQKMNERYGSRPEDLLAGIGPSIGPCCFEVGEDVAGIFEAMFPEYANDIVHPKTEGQTGDDGKWTVDLWEANRRILLDAGLREENITVTDLCTKCREEYFYSHRRQGNARGTMAAFIELI